MVLTQKRHCHVSRRSAEWAGLMDGASQMMRTPKGFCFPLGPSQPLNLNSLISPPGHQPALKSKFPLRLLAVCLLLARCLFIVRLLSRIPPLVGNDDTKRKCRVNEEELKRKEQPGAAKSSPELPHTRKGKIQV